MNAIKDILAGYSIEMTTKDAATFGDAARAMPQPAEVYIPYLPEESDEARVGACVDVRNAGFEPVPHISARRLTSVDALDALLVQLRQRAGVETVFLIAGDIAEPVGPFIDSLSVIQSGLFKRHGIKKVGIAGHPDGHPDVEEDVLRRAMRDKIEALREQGIQSQIVTQFSFDAQRVVRWLEQVRDDGVTVPVRVGIPGPAGVRTLLRYATRCGVSASASVIAKYGLSLSKLLGTSGPDKFLAEMISGMGAKTGDVRLHIFPFGGFSSTADWLAKVAPLAVNNRAA